MPETVLADNVWVGTAYLAGGTRRGDIDPDLAARIGPHLWITEGAKPNVSPDGVALSGLKDNVWVDGVLYEKGTRPSADVAAKIGDHLWVDGPPAATSAPAEPPAGEAPAVAGPVVGSAGQSSIDSEGDDKAATPPPKSGPQGSRQAWLDYAGAVQVEVPADAKRDDIIAAIEAAGRPVG